MINAVVLINTSIDNIPEVAETVAGMDGVSEVYSVSGRYDLVAIVRVKEHERIAEVVTGHIAKVDGVESTETLIAFRTYSDELLDSGFSLGYRSGS